MSKQTRKPLNQAKARRRQILLDWAIGLGLFLAGAAALVVHALLLPDAVLRSPWLTFVAKALLTTTAFFAWRKPAAQIVAYCSSRRAHARELHSQSSLNDGASALTGQGGSKEVRSSMRKKVPEC